MLGRASPQLSVRFKQFAATKPNIILGTASKSRRAIFDELSAQFQLTYSVQTADIDEKAIRYPDPSKLVLALGEAKRDAIIAKQSKKVPGSYLITCDQVVVWEGLIREKPESEEECRTFIEGYYQSPASTVGSTVVTCIEDGRSVSVVDTCFIYFSPIPSDVVGAMIKEGDCLYCAGGLQVEHPLIAPYVERIDGSKDGVMGLSKDSVIACLLKLFDEDLNSNFSG